MPKEMCKATYRAEQTGGEVEIVATGEHHCPGFSISFERVGVTIFPPQFSLMHEPPEGKVAKARTPFSHRVRFETDQKVDNVVVYDSEGRHIVEVCQPEDQEAERAGLGLDD